MFVISSENPNNITFNGRKFFFQGENEMGQDGFLI